MQARPRRIPQRTCVACRSTSGKRELVRVVRTPEGAIEVDETGKKAGRGAYLCANRSCWAEALKKGRLDSALRTKLSADDRLRLTQYATSLREAVIA
ncbi:MAG TPA: YlxR family protein [Dehalococcoidia bacterium]|nr:YlxR family protein [Dehalococcoidia bacterium]